VLKRLTVLDERNIWYGPMIEAAQRRGYEAQRIRRGTGATPGGLGFLRPHAVPAVLKQNLDDYLTMAERMAMVQDLAQVEVYEDKSAQFWRWSQYMPATWRFDERERAFEFVRNYHGALVSKADVGASSYNVRILHTQAEQLNHVQQLFGRGVHVDHCAGGPGGAKVTSLQRGYALLQEYIPHSTTVRINTVGRCYATFLRYNAPGTQTAQTGNVDGLTEPHPAGPVAMAIAEAIGTKWCAFDFLQAADGEYKLLETSLAWPWPSPGNCMEARFFGPTEHRWANIWDLMLDEYEAETWTAL
jgi:hypothetical protein